MARPRRIQTGPVEKLTRKYVVRLKKRLCVGRALSLEEQHLLLGQVEGLLTDNKALRQQVEDKHQALTSLQHHLDALAPAPHRGAVFLDWAIHRAELLAEMLETRSGTNPSQDISTAIVGVSQAISALGQEKREKARTPTNEAEDDQGTNERSQGRAADDPTGR